MKYTYAMFTRHFIIYVFYLKKYCVINLILRAKQTFTNSPFTPSPSACNHPLPAKKQSVFCKTVSAYCHLFTKDATQLFKQIIIITLGYLHPRPKHPCYRIGTSSPSSLFPGSACQSASDQQRPEVNRDHEFQM